MTEDPDTSWHRRRGDQPPLRAAVICTPTALNPVTAACLAQYAPGADIRPITPADKYGMWEHLAEYWDDPRPLIHADHDMVFVYDNLAGLADCSIPWCICPAWSLGVHVTMGLGLVKFTAAIRAAVPAAQIRAAMDACPQCHGMWWHVEHHIAGAFLGAGFVPHQHEDVLHDHTELLKRVTVSRQLAVAVAPGGVSYIRDYYEETSSSG